MWPLSTAFKAEMPFAADEVPGALPRDSPCRPRHAANRRWHRLPAKPGSKRGCNAPSRFSTETMNQAH